jgi:hypothetical protein
MAFKTPDSCLICDDRHRFSSEVTERVGLKLVNAELKRVSRCAKKGVCPGGVSRLIVDRSVNASK